MAGEAGIFAGHARTQLAKVIVGQGEVINQLLTVLLCGGHVLLEGVPGTAKTLAVKALARVCRLEFQRVQCTPDLMPADILGANIFNLASSTFSLHRGPVFTDLLLVDEVNRMPPRTQAALLESMEERQVTLDGARYPLSIFFTVFATQNPVEFEGTYPLPEAELDRFLFKIRIDYPEADHEIEVLNRYQGGFDPRDLDKVGLDPVDTELLTAARREAASVRAEPALLRYISTIVRRTRDWPTVSLGGSTRATVNLLLASKTLAAIEGRDYLIPDDVKAAALPVLRHRLVVKPEADLEGITSDRVVTDVLGGVEVPK
ncbi:MAG: magnesium chelatase [Acidobacteria bacterium]|nr:MAG: magnesium chelatase [Acidobacteriota bacterium]